MVVNNRYSLITLRNSASYHVVVKTVFTTGSPEELKLIETIKSRADSFPDNTKVAEKYLLENPNHVLFAPSMSVKATMDNYPCLITETSSSLFRVRFLDLI